MASMPQTHLDDHPFPSDLYQDFQTPPALARGGSVPTVSGGHHAPTWTSHDQLEISYPFPFFFDHYAGLPESDVVPMMSASSSLQPERHDYMGAVDMMAVPVLPADHLNIMCGGSGYQNGSGLRHEFVDDHYCFGFGSDDGNFKSISPSSDDNSTNQCHKLTSSVEESSIKVGRYSAEERKDRILRYLKKRNQRNFNKTIKYACRKTLADRRVRVRGRFARNNELSEEETIIKKNINYAGGEPNHKQSDEFFSGEEAIQLKHDDEDWLQEAMASLIYLPYA